MRRDGPRVRIDGQHDPAHVRAVRTRLHDGSGAVGAGDRRGPGVLLVRVPGEDRVHLRGGVVDDVRERAARGELLVESGAVRRALGSALVVHRDEHVRLAVRRVAVAELRRDAVADPAGGDERGRLFGDRADHAHGQAARVEKLVRREGGRRGPLQVDVRAELRVVRRRSDAVAKVDPPAVELVVAHGGRLHAEGVEHVDGGLVLGDRGREEGRTDVVAG